LYQNSNREKQGTHTNTTRYFLIIPKKKAKEGSTHLIQMQTLLLPARTINQPRTKEMPKSQGIETVYRHPQKKGLINAKAQTFQNAASVLLIICVLVLQLLAIIWLLFLG
jgi:hypothetical protein